VKLLDGVSIATRPTNLLSPSRPTCQSVPCRLPTGQAPLDETWGETWSETLAASTRATVLAKWSDTLNS
jgi:hypothetical protein